MPDFNRSVISPAETKGKPFQAQFEQVVSQKQSDGRTARRTMTGTISRDAEGRRREESRVEVMPGLVANIAQIHNPTNNTYCVLDLESKTASRLVFPSGSKSLEGVLIFSDSPHPSNREDLGQQQVEGLPCRGTRLRSGDSVIEYWHWDDLGEVLSEKRVSKDEESTWRLFNIRRVEPDRTLFTVPADYKEARDLKEGETTVEAAKVASASAHDESGREALFEAATVGDASALRKLLAKGMGANLKNEDGNTPLILAAWFGRTETVKALLAGGADVDAKEKVGMTALMRAASEGSTETVKALLTGGANVNAKDVDRTALMFAALFGHSETAKALMAAGADVNAHMDNGNTVLMIALGFGKAGHKDIVQALLAHGVEVNVKNSDGYTVLQLAQRAGCADIVELLKKAGAKE
jgi:hypothetical protein